MIAGVVSYMLLCWGGFAVTSPYSSELFFWGGGGLPPGFCYVCVGLVHLVL